MPSCKDRDETTRTRLRLSMLPPRKLAMNGRALLVACFVVLLLYGSIAYVACHHWRLP